MVFIATLLLSAAGDAPRVFVLDPQELANGKDAGVVATTRGSMARHELLQKAEAALDEGPWSVVEKPFTPPSGDRHDYMSVGPYWWPNPETEDGLPYIRKDGVVNPERNDYDSAPMAKMVRAVETLAAAYWYTGEERFARHAALVLRVWFLFDTTRMNPNLQYGQAIPGRCEGRGIGIIDTTSLIGLTDAVGLLESSEAWEGADQAELEDWFSDYLDWLLESKHGRDEAATKNNHGTWYDAQVMAYALFCGREDVAERIARTSAKARIDKQIEADGRQPHELARTKSFGYSIYNLKGMFAMAALAEHVGAELWHYEGKDGGSIRKALDWLAETALGGEPWPYEQIGGVKPEALIPLLERAADAYDEPRYAALAREMGGE